MKGMYGIFFLILWSIFHISNLTGRHTQRLVFLETDTIMHYDEIKQRYACELQKMNEIIQESLQSDNALMDSIVRKYLQVKGKQVRPLMVILCAGMFGEINSHVLHAGAALEMLHNASLIHDDVVDETTLRRGVQTINARWDNRIAVLVGDFFVSKSLAVGTATENINIIRAISDLGCELSLGEIEQICNVKQHSLSIDNYMSMISQKTASLFVCCAKMGAEAVGVDETQYINLVKFAEILGLCFQIKDDIFDYFPNANIGKPTGNDLREGKITLPLLHAIEITSDQENSKIKELVRNPEITQQDIDECLQFAINHGGIDYAYQYMNRLREDALEYLHTYPHSTARDSLESLLDYIISRKN